MLGEHREHGKDGKYQPDDLKHFYASKDLITVWLKKSCMCLDAAPLFAQQHYPLTFSSHVKFNI